MRADLALKPVNVSLKKRIVSAMSTIRDPGVLKPLIIINVFNALQLASGTYIIVFYAVDMIKDIGKQKKLVFFAKLGRENKTSFFRKEKIDISAEK